MQLEGQLEVCWPLTAWAVSRRPLQRERQVCLELPWVRHRIGEQQGVTIADLIVAQLTEDIRKLVFAPV